MSDAVKKIATEASAAIAETGFAQEKMDTAGIHLGSAQGASTSAVEDREISVEATAAEVSAKTVLARA